MKNDHDDSKQQQQMDQGTGDMKADKPNRPQNEQKKADYDKHSVILPSKPPSQALQSQLFAITTEK
jgi:hypothetical protein